MKYMRQFGIIMLVTCIGEILKYLIPLAIPSSIYGLCLMMVLLVTGIVKVDDVKESGTFLIEIMPLMFIASGVGIVVYWKQLKTMLIPLIIITFVSTVLVIGCVRKSNPVCDKRGRKNMNQMIINSTTIGVVISVMGYELGLLLKRKFKSAIFNPLLISIIICNMLSAFV